MKSTKLKSPYFKGSYAFSWYNTNNKQEDFTNRKENNQITIFQTTNYNVISF